MGMKLFGSSSLGLNDMLYESANNIIDPIPDKFKIIDLVQEGNYVCAEIQYPNCTNFEGTKIIVFKDATVEEVKSMALIDPHFLEGNKVFARFRPTPEGKLASVACCVELSKHNL